MTTSADRTSSAAGIDEAALDGRAASGDERERARNLAELLEALAAAMPSDAEAARALQGAADARIHPLSDHAGALAAVVRAHGRTPSYSVARTHRRAALHAGAHDQVLAALASEARLAPRAGDRAALEAHRGLLLETSGDLTAARHAYSAALEAGGDAGAHLGLLRLALHGADTTAAARHTIALASTVGDGATKAELLCYAARLSERAGRNDEAAQLAAQASLLDPASASVLFFLERNATTADAQRALCAALERAAGTSLPAGVAWIEVGVYAKMALGDLQLAERALAAAAAHGEGAVKASAQQLLAEVWAARGAAPQAIDAFAQIAQSATEPLERAITWSQVGSMREAAEDAAGAAEAYRAALEALPSYLPALEGAGRTHARLNDVERMVWAHLSEAEHAPSDLERAIALRRAADLLASEPAGRARAIELLGRAWSAAPGHEGIFRTLERLLQRAESWTQLRTLYEDALQHAKVPAQRARLLMRLGALCARGGVADPSRAIAAYREAAELPASGRELANAELERVLEEIGDHEALEATLRAACEVVGDPRQLATFEEQLAGLCEQRGDAEGALVLYRRAIERVAVTHSVVAAACRAFARAEEWRPLLALYERTARDGGPAERISYGYKCGTLLARQLGDADAAIARFEQVLRDAPNHAPTAVALAALYETRQRWPELADTLALLPSTPLRRLKRAMAIELGGQHDPAIWETLAVDDATLARRGASRALARQRRWVELAERCERDAKAGGGPDASHLRTRAAELRAELLHDRAGAMALHDEAMGPLPLLTLLARPAGEAAPPGALERAADALRDSSLRAALLAEAAARPDGEGLAPRVDRVDRWLALAAVDAVTGVHRERVLETRGERAQLIEHLRAHLPADEAAASEDALRLAVLLEELGAQREAIDALERAGASMHPPLAAAIMLPRLYAAVDDGERTRLALSALAEALPDGEVRAAVLRRLAALLARAGDRERAVGALEWALRSEPRDFVALRHLAALVEDDDPERMIAPLLRAWEGEEPGPRRLEIGMAAIVRQIRLGRHDGARQGLDRVLAEHPQHLPALLARAELEGRTGRWSVAAEALSLIAGHAEADDELRRDALTRLVKARLGPLGEVAGAVEAAKLLCELPGGGASALELAYRAADAAGLPDDAIELLEKLSEHADLDEHTRAGYTIALAALLDQHRGDALAAIDRLRRVQLPARRREAIERLMELGEKSNRWDVAAGALEQALERRGELEPSWEIAIRCRLAALFDGPLERRESAVRQYERVVELDPGQLAPLERLAELSAADPPRAVAHQRALLAADPTRLGSYRALRKTLLALTDDDGAFLVEAILEGTGVADEEESYFFKQRRARMQGMIKGSLSADELALLDPGHDAFLLLRAITPVLSQVFPVDPQLYGAAEDAARPSATLQHTAERVATLFGLGAVELRLVGSRVGPCVELGTPVPLFVPRALDEAAPREQAFVLGELLGRAAFGLQIGDPRRGNAITPTELEYVLWAACEEVVPEVTAPTRGKPVYEDIRRRLGAALGSVDRSGLVAAARALAAAPADIDGKRLLERMTETAVCAGLVCAQDPAIALASLRQRDGLGPGLEALRPAVLRSLAFVLSGPHAALRKRLGLGVS